MGNGGRNSSKKRIRLRIRGKWYQSGGLAGGWWMLVEVQGIVWLVVGGGIKTAGGLGVVRED